MKRLVAVFSVMCGPAIADEALEVKYRATADACYGKHEDTGADIEPCYGLLSEACMNEEPGGQSNLGMTQCTHAEAAFWDEKLNLEYRQARAAAEGMDADSREYEPEYAIRADKLRDAQRAWIAFRDAECAFDYSIWGSGSMRQIWGASCFSRMTFERTEDLIGFQETMQ